MLYSNPKYRKIKGSCILLVSCGNCKKEIVKYQKLGKGNILRMYMDRIIEGNIKLSGEFICPDCDKLMGRRVILKKEGREFFKMVRSSFNTKKI